MRIEIDQVKYNSEDLVLEISWLNIAKNISKDELEAITAYTQSEGFKETTLVKCANCNWSRFPASGAICLKDRPIHKEAFPCENWGKR